MLTLETKYHSVACLVIYCWLFVSLYIALTSHVYCFSELLENEKTGGYGTQVCDQDGRICTCSIVYNDAKYVNERARNDIVLLSR